MIELCFEYLSARYVRLYVHVTIQCRFTLKRVRGIITHTQMFRTDKYSQHSSIIWPIWLNGWMFVYELNACGFESRYCHLNFGLFLTIHHYTYIFNEKLHFNCHIAPVSSKEFLDIQATIVCRFTLKRVSDTIITYSQMHCTDKYNSSIIWPVWLNGWATSFGFKSRCCHLISHTDN